MERTTIVELLERARSMLERLEPEQALEAQQAGALIVDVRSHDELVRHGMIPGSVHIPRTVLEWRLDPDSPYSNGYADLTRHVILVCADGYSSSLAAATLQELGYSRATDLVGGFNTWKTRGLPVSAVRPDDGAGIAAPAPA